MALLDKAKVLHYILGERDVYTSVVILSDLGVLICASTRDGSYEALDRLVVT